MGLIVRGIAAGIGFAREAYANKRSTGNKDIATEGEDSIHNVTVTPSDKDIPAPISNDDFLTPSVVPEKGTETKAKSGERACSFDDAHRPQEETHDDELPLYGSWELDEADEAQDEIIDSESLKVQTRVSARRIVPQKEIPHLAEKFAAAYPLNTDMAMPRINCSVILPQKRPESRKRGFIRAYSPVLASKGIDEECFLDFVETFNIASQANPYLYAINLAQFSAHALSPAIGTAVAEAIRLAVDTGIEVQGRYRTNVFLDKINKLWFLPRGLICFPMIWKPSVSSLVTNVSMDNTVAQQVGGEKGFLGNFSGGAATSRGNVHFPDAAPLVFPILDTVAESSDESAQTLKAKLANSMRFTNDYSDRRAQARYAMKNPHSELSHLGVRPEFKSRYSDPNNPAASGSLLGLLTGGAVSTHNRRQLRRQNQKGGLFDGSGQRMASASTAAVDTMRDMRLSNVLKVMRGKQVLYLVIVDAPTREEVAEAQRIVDEMGGLK